MFEKLRYATVGDSRACKVGGANGLRCPKSSKLGAYLAALESSNKLEYTEQPIGGNFCFPFTFDFRRLDGQSGAPIRRVYPSSF